MGSYCKQCAIVLKQSISKPSYDFIYLLFGVFTTAVEGLKGEPGEQGEKGDRGMAGLKGEKGESVFNYDQGWGHY